MLDIYNMQHNYRSRSLVTINIGGAKCTQSVNDQKTPAANSERSLSEIKKCIYDKCKFEED